VNLRDNFHPLFLPEPDGNPDYEPEEFAKISITRQEASGPLRRTEAPNTRVMRMYDPEDLNSLERFQELFGGGTYQIHALRANGTFYARRFLRVPGNSKPLEAVVEDGGASSSAASTSSLAGMPALDPTVALIISMNEKSAQQSSENNRLMISMMTQMMGTMMSAIATIVSSQNNKPQESIGDLMRGFAEMTKANMPPAPPVDGMTALKNTLEASKLVQEVAAKNSKQPEETTSEIVRTVGEVAGPLVMGLLEKRNEAAAAAGAAGASVPGLPTA